MEICKYFPFFIAPLKSFWDMQVSHCASLLVLAILQFLGLQHSFWNFEFFSSFPTKWSIICLSLLSIFSLLLPVFAFGMFYYCIFVWLSVHQADKWFMFAVLDAASGDSTELGASTSHFKELKTVACGILAVFAMTAASPVIAASQVKLSSLSPMITQMKQTPIIRILLH